MHSAGPAPKTCWRRINSVSEKQKSRKIRYPKPEPTPFGSYCYALTCSWIEFILPRLLHNNDLHSMHFSLEVRVPFADTELLGAAARVHPLIAFRDEGAAFKGNRVKRWLRHCAKGLIPEEIRLRKKSPTPFPRYVSGIYKRELKAILRRGGEEFYEEFLDVPRLTALCDETPDENRTAFLFRCIAFYYWVKHHRITGFA